MSAHDWRDRAADAAMNGYTFRSLIHEVVGAASVCWDENGVFDTEAALDVAKDAEEAIAEFLRVAINQQSLDVRADMADRELVELIFQAPAMNGETHE